MNKAIKSLAAAALMAALLTGTVAATPIATPQEGIDVSHYDEAVDFAQVRASGRTFAFIKSGDGAGTQGANGGLHDAWYIHNSQSATASGVAWGPYYFFRPYSVASATYQAEQFWAQIRGTGYTLKPVIDIEVYRDKYQTSAEVRECLTAFISRYKELAGNDSLTIYSGTSYLNETAIPKYFNQYPIWQADYRGYIGGIGSDAAVWQYSEDGTVPGCTAPSVDLDRLYDNSVYMSGAAGSSQPAPAAAARVQRGNSTIWTIQCQLNDTGIARPKLAEDGINGPATKSQIRVLEQVAGIKVDAGIWGPQCVSAIGTIYSHPTLSVGSRGVAVRYLQYMLGLPIDGIFGRQTQAAVIRRQQAAGLAADGIVGPAAWGTVA